MDDWKVDLSGRVKVVLLDHRWVVWLDGTMVHAKAVKKEFSMVVLMVYLLVPLTVD